MRTNPPLAQTLRFHINVMARHRGLADEGGFELRKAAAPWTFTFTADMMMVSRHAAALSGHDSKPPAAHVRIADSCHHVVITTPPTPCSSRRAVLAVRPRGKARRSKQRQTRGCVSGCQTGHRARRHTAAASETATPLAKGNSALDVEGIIPTATGMQPRREIWS